MLTILVYFTVYSLGNNSYGQCGRVIVENEKFFASRRVNLVQLQDKESQKNETIVDVSHFLYATSFGTFLN